MTDIGKIAGAGARPVDRDVRLLIYSEAFCPLSETFVYRTAIGLASFSTTILTHQRLNATEFPDAHLRIRVLKQNRRSRLRRAVAIMKNAAYCNVPSADVLIDADRDDAAIVPEADVMLAHFATCGFRILPVALRRKVPLVTMFHGCDIGSWLGFPGYRRCLNTLFRGGTAFIVATEYMREKAIALGCPPEKLHKIPYPIPELPEIEGLRRLKKSEAPLQFLHVGRLHEQKGILFTIKAFAIVNQERPDTELVVVGDGPHRAMAEDLVGKLGLGARVMFRRAVPFSRVREELATADVYVIHSVTTVAGDTEGFGVSLAEASEARLPIVATRHNGFPDVVLDGRTGFLVPERDIHAMADAMLELSSDSRLRATMGDQGQAHVRRAFAPEKIMGQYTSLFSSLLEQ